MAAAEEKKDAQNLQVLLGDEAVALGSVHAGLTAAYAYPGTPSTEIVEYLIRHKDKYDGLVAHWTANEKTAMEAGLGTSFVGRRGLVCMKHVGLNVSADPFMNASVVSINGGLVVAVADDPGMHSSQNEQDSRYFADFAHTILLEPANQQETYDMTRDAFDISERFHLPVVIRLTTRLAHSRAAVQVAESRKPNPIRRASDASSWILLPSNARVEWQKVLDQSKTVDEWSENNNYNRLELKGSKLGVITSGNASNYFLENARELDDKPSHLHIGAYPIPQDKIRKLAAHVDRILVVEDGYPFIERFLRGVLDQPVKIQGRMSGELPLAGELNSDILRRALGLPKIEARGLASMGTPGRPPQLCAGCPHIDSFGALKEARASFENSVVTSDIGCYTLAALPPYNAIDSCVCMGASIGMAKGSAEAGLRPAVAVIGDGTFAHSGITALLDVVADKAPITLVILDNETTGMTGGQPTIIPSSKLKKLVLGTGMDPEHVFVVDAHRRAHENNVELLKKELAFEGPSVVIAVRECIETLKRHGQEKKLNKAKQS